MITMSRILYTIVIILTVFVSMNMISHAVQSQQQIQQQQIQEQEEYPYTNETNFTILYSPPLKLPGSEIEMIYVIPVPNIDANTSISMNNNNESIDINKTRGS